MVGPLAYCQPRRVYEAHSTPLATEPWQTRSTCGKHTPTASDSRFANRSDPNVLAPENSRTRRAACRSVCRRQFLNSATARSPDRADPADSRRSSGKLGLGAASSVPDSEPLATDGKRDRLALLGHVNSPRAPHCSGRAPADCLSRQSLSNLSQSKFRRYRSSVYCFTVHDPLQVRHVGAGIELLMIDYIALPQGRRGRCGFAHN
jgi:hypothetical protein